MSPITLVTVKVNCTKVQITASKFISWLNYKSKCFEFLFVSLLFYDAAWFVGCFCQFLIIVLLCFDLDDCRLQKLSRWS